MSKKECTYTIRHNNKPEIKQQLPKMLTNFIKTTVVANYKKEIENQNP